MPLLDMERRLELSDLLAHEADAVELHDSLDKDGEPIGPARDVIELTLDVLDGDGGPDRVVVEDDLGILPPAPGEIALLAGPADFKISAGPKRSAAVEPQSELRHQGGHFLAEIAVEADLFDPGVVNIQIEPAAVFQEDGSVREGHGRPAEVEARLVHGNFAVVEDEQAADVIQGQLDRTAGINSGLWRPRDFQAHARLGTRDDPDLGAFRGLGMQMNLRLDVAGTGGIDRGPDPLPGPGKCPAQLAAEREVCRGKLDVDLQGILAMRAFCQRELLDTAAGLDPGLPVASGHIFKCPLVWVNFQASFQVANRKWQADPVDLAALGQIDVGVKSDEPFGACRCAAHGRAHDLGPHIHQAAGVEFIDDLAHVGRDGLLDRLVDRQ